MTKFIDETKQEKQEKNKSTTFVKYISCDGESKDTDECPDVYDKVILINRRDIYDKFDIMIGILDSNPDIKCVYLGYWNDGC